MGIKFYLILITLIIASFYDIKYREVSNLASLFIFLISLYKLQLINLLAIIVLPLPLIFTNIKMKDNFGGADIKILASLGLYMGIKKGMIMLLIALFIEIIIKKITKKESMPFIPYILIGYILTNNFVKG